MYIVIGVEQNEISHINEYMSVLNEYPQIGYQFFETNNTYYPINKLRNIAIKNINTTHFFVCDMDFWPSCIKYLCFPIIVGLYNQILELHHYILNDDWLAIIVPGFQYKRNLPLCHSFQECVEMYKQHTLEYNNRIIPTVPENKKDLKKCIIDNYCTTFANKTLYHVLINIYSFSIYI